jgi:Zn-finger nucleic acid-binding protein
MHELRRDRSEPMRCPNCAGRLVELERSEVLIDACPECRGVWLDRGELDRILERERRALTGARDDDEDFFREMSGQPGRQEPRDHDDHQERRQPADHGRHDKKRKRRGFLEDLFEFD